MSTEKHTPEPWESGVSGTAKSRVPMYVIHRIERISPGNVIMHRIGKFNRMEDADHACKCVNACAGMNDPEAEITQMKSQLQEVVEFLEHVQCDISANGRRATVLLAKIKGGANAD